MGFGGFFVFRYCPPHIRDLQKAEDGGGASVVCKEVSDRDVPAHFSGLGVGGLSGRMGKDGGCKRGDNSWKAKASDYIHCPPVSNGASLLPIHLPRSYLLIFPISLA